MADLLALQETLYTSRNPTRQWLHCSRRGRIEADLRRVAKAAPHERVLEIGPGSGVYLPVLAELFDHVVVTDVEDVFLERARNLASSFDNVTVIRDDITATALEAESFDVVLCSEVVEHIYESEAAFQGMHRLLRRGGYLVVSTPQRYSPLEVTARLAFLPGVINVVRAIYREPIVPTGHINLLTARQARAQLVAAGFEIVTAAQSGMYLPVLAEVGGRRALKLEQWLERRLEGRRGSGTLWTQYYVARVSDREPTTQLPVDSEAASTRTKTRPRPRTPSSRADRSRADRGFL